MARTVVGVNSPLAVKRFSAALAADTPKESYFDQRFVGEGEPATLPIQRLTELENDAGEQITFDLSVQLKQQPIEGDNIQEGTEEGLEFHSAMRRRATSRILCRLRLRVMRPPPSTPHLCWSM